MYEMKEKHKAVRQCEASFREESHTITEEEKEEKHFNEA
jgi:hypothetical protein